MEYLREITYFFVTLSMMYIVNILLGKRSTLSALPGPWHTRYTNAILRFHTLAGRRIFYIHDLHQAYGSVVRISPTEVAVSDIEAISRIHRIGGGFQKSRYYEDLTPGRDLSIFSLREPSAHNARRKLFARAFTKSSLHSNWEADVREKAELAVRKIKIEAAGSGNGADLLKWWTLMAADIIAHLSFGESFNALQQGKQTDYLNAIQDACTSFIIHSELPFAYHILRFTPVKRIQQIMKAEKLVDDHGELAIQNMRQGNKSGTNLFGLMMASSDGDTVTLTEKQIREEAANFIIAGSDTTSVTLTYVIWAVLKHPEIQDQLQEEVSELSAELLFSELEVAPVLNSVIHETLRLYAGGPGAMIRVVPTQGLTVNGYDIPGGAEISTHTYTLCRDPTIFEDPFQFKPSRFTDIPNISQEQNIAFMPFGAGARMCLGLHLAWMELRLATALFFRHCRGARLSECMTDEMMEIENQFLISPKGHCCFVRID